MRIPPLPLAFGTVFLTLAPGTARAADAPAAVDPVVARLEAVADYQLAHPGRAKMIDWVQSAFLAGLSAVDRMGVAGNRYHAALLGIGEANRWILGPRVYHADDLCTGQTYLELYEKDRDPRMLAAMRERCDFILAHPIEGSLVFEGKARSDRWSWCDALFMAPTGWARLAKVTGNQAYLQYAVQHWRKTSDFLYDRTEHLFWRDSTYFTRRETNGRKVFWSRGNGWVLAGLARMLEYLPAENPARPQFERQFQEMAARIVQLQQPDGSWASSLLDPENCRPKKETSGTGFYCYALAWGVNHGLLERTQFAGPASRAWTSLQDCVEPSGRLNHVQPIGATPTDFSPSSTEPFGVGAFLLAGSEVDRLVQSGAAGR